MCPQPLPGKTPQKVALIISSRYLPECLSLTTSPWLSHLGPWYKLHTCWRMPKEYFGKWYNTWPRQWNNRLRVFTPHWFGCKCGDVKICLIEVKTGIKMSFLGS